MNTRGCIPYSRKTLTVDEVVEKLKSEGLNFSNEPQAKEFLQKITYHRFKFYLHPFLVSLDPKDKPKRFKENVDFSSAINLYLFNKELSILILQYISEIEVFLRKALDSFFISQNKGYFWYLEDCYIFQPTQTQLHRFRHEDPAYKPPVRRIKSIREKLKKQFLESQELHNQHYRNKYKNGSHGELEELPPFWHISELMTLGQLYDYINSLNVNMFIQNSRTNYLDELALQFGATKFKHLLTWIEALREIRNRCAHHNRVFNANYINPNLKDINLEYRPSKPNRLYGILLVLDAMYFKLKNEHIKKDLEAVIDKYNIDAHLTSCGFPKEWRTDKCWTQPLSLVESASAG